MEQVRHFFAFLIHSGLVNLNDIVEESNGRWKLVKDYAGITSGTAFQDRTDMVNRITAAVLQKYQATGGLKAVS